MPIHRGKDKNGPFYQWGSTGKRYYYVSGDKESREKALSKARRQEKAIYASGYSFNIL